MAESAHDHARHLLAKKIEAKISYLTNMFYDTEITPARMYKEGLPYIAEDVFFKDPWQCGKGKDVYKLGMKGFHSMLNFDFVIHQTSVTLEEKKPGHDYLEGRAMVDGVMNLRQLSWIYTYPLRTILVYKFRVYTDKGFGNITAARENDIHFEIFYHEEMWSFGDMIQNLPLAAVPYNVFRSAFASCFLVASKVSGWFQVSYRGQEWQ